MHKLYPDASSTPDDQGYLPLHYACASIASRQTSRRRRLQEEATANNNDDGDDDLNVIRYLVRVFPKAIHSQTAQNKHRPLTMMTPVECCYQFAGNGDGWDLDPTTQEVISMLKRLADN